MRRPRGFRLDRVPLALPVPVVSRLSRKALTEPVASSFGTSTVFEKALHDSALLTSRTSDRRTDNPVRLLIVDYKKDGQDCPSYIVLSHNRAG